MFRKDEEGNIKTERRRRRNNSKHKYLALQNAKVHSGAQQHITEYYSILQYSSEDNKILQWTHYTAIYSTVDNNIAYHSTRRNTTVPIQYSTPHHTIPHHTIPYHTIPYHTTPHHTTPHHTTPQHTTPHHTTQHNTTQQLEAMHACATSLHYSTYICQYRNHNFVRYYDLLLREGEGL
jgi:hypothetical protein